MIEEGVKEILAFQSRQKQLLDKAREDAERIRQVAQESVNRLFEEGVLKFNQMKEEKISLIKEQVKKIEVDLLEKKKVELDALYEVYKKNMLEIRKQIFKRIIQIRDE